MMGHLPTNTRLGVAESYAKPLVEGPGTLPANIRDAMAMSLTAKLFRGLVSLEMDAAYDQWGAISLNGEKTLVAWAADWLNTATGFQGHSVGYPKASPRDVHFALLGKMDDWHITDLLVDDAAPPAPLPKGAVS